MEALQLLNANRVIELRETLKKEKMNLNNLHFTYDNGGSLLIDGIGMPGIVLDEEYYENIEENITYADFSWLAPLCTTFRTRLKAEISVLPDGSLNHQSVQLSVNFMLPRDVTNIHSYAYSRFSSFIPFRHFVKKVEVKGHKGSIQNIIFHMEVDGKKVNGMLKNKTTVNSQILSQWLATMDQVIQFNRGRYKFCDTIPVVNGKMSYSTSTSTISFKYNKLGETK